MTENTSLMAGKKGLIMGVANDHSIAWGIARALHAQGAELAPSLALLLGNLAQGLLQLPVFRRGKLGDTDGSLHVSELQVVADMGVRVLVVIPVG